MRLVFHTAVILFQAIVLGLPFVGLPFLASAESLCEPEVSRLVSAQGRVDAYHAQASQWESAQQGQPYCGDDKVRTGALSRAVLSMEKGIATFLALDQLTLLNFVKSSGRVMLSIETGQVHIRSHTPSRFDVTTPFVNAGIEGTEFLVKADDHSAEISVFEGKVRVFNNQGEILITKGQTALSNAGEAPVLKQIDIKPDDAVRWALYYPPIIDFTNLGSLSNDPQIQLANQRYQNGDVLGAIDQLTLLIDRQPNANLLATQAGLLLTLGRVDSAEYLIQKAQTLEPNHATLNALQAIIALTRNDKDRARQLAQTAIDSHSESPIPYVALSYIEQANFNLDLALEAIEKALELPPQSGLIYCRKAELLASQNEIKLAKEAAEKALSLSPQLGRTHVVLGFMQLMDTYTDIANNSFQQAIELDSSDPLANFGQALAKIRGGDLTVGVAQLEIAASLDPNNSLIRSYLGKAYYEQKKDSVAELQFELAKDNDPKDPTPYFYSAIQKHAQNRPIEALIDMEKAIDLNDNRAVYRSTQMLDSDLASRGAAIGRIYKELGFGPRALVHAWTALADDPTDYSAHRLLSDTYASLPRSDMARTSELLQSQLLQPVNISPVQPRLAESSQFLVGNLGPSALSLNEFNPVFERNRFSTTTSGQIGSNNTYSDEIVHSGLWNDWSYSLGQFHYQTDGYKTNNGINVNLYNAFVQGRLTPYFSIQGEYRHKELDYGYLDSKFFPNEFYTQIDLDHQENTTEKNIYRIGFNWSPSQQNTIIGTYNEFKSKESIIYNAYEFFDGNRSYFLDKTQSSYLVSGNNLELQYQLDLWDIKSIFGGELGKVKYEFNSFAINQDQSNTYIYSYFKFPKSTQWTVGVSTNTYNGDTNISRSYNPKLGLIWRITPKTTFRASGFKTLKSSWFKGESLEPTQISGFNQVFSDEHNIPTRHYGIGLDHNISNTMSFGIEGTGRKFEIKYDDSQWEEHQYRFYLIWSPFPQWVFNIEYLQEDFRNKNLIETFGIPSDTHTTYIPVKFAYFNSNGFFFSFKGTNYQQHINIDSDNGQDSGVFLDIGTGFRLPRRLGIFELDFQNILNQKYNYQDYVDRGENQSINGMPSNLPFPLSFTVSARLTLAF